jgi:hypothetical protein
MVVFKEFRVCGRFEKSFIATFVSLILKKARAVEIKDFRPINIVGEVYKIIVKFMANRFQLVFGKILKF